MFCAFFMTVLIVLNSVDYVCSIGQYLITVGHMVSGNTKELYPLQPGIVCLVVFSSSSHVGSSAVNKLVGESRVTAHVNSIANDDLYSSVVLKTAPPGFNFLMKSFTLGRLPWAEHSKISS